MSDWESSESVRNGRNPSSQGAAWRKGARVLAPWEPMFLYSGTVEQVAGGRALIQFDDGDAGWVDLPLLQPLVLKSGQRVLSRRRMGPMFFPGAISEVNGEQVTIEFDDGKEEIATVASLRIPCEPVSGGAQAVKATSHRAFLEFLGQGSRVWALWNNAAFFAGTVRQLHETEADIEFDDGDQVWVPLAHLLPLDVIVGMFVMARRRTGPDYFPGMVSDTEGDRVQVRFDDGPEEWTTAAALALPVQSPGAAAVRPHPAAVAPEISMTPRPQPAAARGGWSPLTVLVLGGVIVVIVAVVFFLLGRD